MAHLKNPKFANIGDYWDDETVGKITDLLHEFQDLFPTKFSEMKGIVGGLREMKIPPNPDANLSNNDHINSIRDIKKNLL